MHTCLHTFIHICIHTYTHMHAYLLTCIHTHMHACLHTYVYSHRCMHAYIHTYIHTYINTYMSKQQQLKYLLLIQPIIQHVHVPFTPYTTVERNKTQNAHTHTPHIQHTHHAHHHHRKRITKKNNTRICIYNTKVFDLLVSETFDKYVRLKSIYKIIYTIACSRLWPFNN